MNCRAFFLVLIFLSPIPITLPRRSMRKFMLKVFEYEANSCSLANAVTEYAPVGLQQEVSFAGKSVEPYTNQVETCAKTKLSPHFLLFVSKISINTIKLVKTSL